MAPRRLVDFELSLPFPPQISLTNSLFPGVPCSKYQFTSLQLPLIVKPA